MLAQIEPEDVIRLTFDSIAILVFVIDNCGWKANPLLFLPSIALVI
jgi:hypothetical protein